VKEFCKRWPKNQYMEVDYWTAWKKMFKNLNDTGIHYYRNGFKCGDLQNLANISQQTETLETETTNVKSDSEEEYESEFDKLKLD